MRPSAEIISSIKIAKLPGKKLKLIQGCPITRETLFQPHFVITFNLCFTSCVVAGKHAVSIRHVEWDDYHGKFWKKLEEGWRDI